MDTEPRADDDDYAIEGLTYIVAGVIFVGLVIWAVWALL